MIKLIPNEDNGKIQKIEITIGELEKVIEPKIHIVFKPSDDKNISKILEKYRALKDEAECYFKENSAEIEKFIRNYISPFAALNPDCVVCFLPADTNRRQLLLDFKEKIIGHLDNKIEIDFSDKFTKKDPLKSIKRHILNKDDFNLSIEHEAPFKSVIVVDDVINEGKTLDIFLEKMKDRKLIDNETDVNAAFIYCFEKIKTGHMDAFRNLNNVNTK